MTKRATTRHLPRLAVYHSNRFRRVGNGYRRREEHHALRLYDRRQIDEWLKQVGFSVRRYASCGNYRLGRNQLIFLARKSRRLGSGH